MKNTSVPTVLSQAVVLPGAGAPLTLGLLSCRGCDEVSVGLSYALNGGSVIGAPTLRVIWLYDIPAWDPVNGPLEGVILQAGVLVVEDFPWATPGAAGSWKRILPLVVPAGATSLRATVRETGDVANPGTIAAIGFGATS